MLRAFVLCLLAFSIAAYLEDTEEDILVQEVTVDGQQLTVHQQSGSRGDNEEKMLAWRHWGIDGEADGDRSGFFVSMSRNGQRVAIGARYNDGNGKDSGHVRVFELTDTGTTLPILKWVQLGGDIDGEAEGDLSGQTVSISGDGARVAIGAHRNDGAGHVRVFELEGDEWRQLGNSIHAKDLGDLSARVSLSENGTRIAIGAPDHEGSGCASGHVRVFELRGIAWIQIQTPESDIVGEAAGDRSGTAVSLSADGTRVAFSAPYSDGDGIQNVGSVRVFQDDGAKWVQLGDVIKGESWADLTSFSVSLSADGTRVAIGAPLRRHVRVFDFDGSAWVQLGSDIEPPSFQADYNEFGAQVSLSADGSRLAIGCPRCSRDGRYDQGAVDILEFTGSTWQRLAFLFRVPASDFYGESVSLSEDGSWIAIGVPGSRTKPSDRGSVSIFKLPEFD